MVTREREDVERIEFTYFYYNELEIVVKLMAFLLLKKEKEILNNVHAMQILFLSLLNLNIHTDTDQSINIV